MQEKRLNKLLMLNFNWGFHYSLGLKQVIKMNQLLEFSKQVITSWCIRTLKYGICSKNRVVIKPTLNKNVHILDLSCKDDLELFRWQF